MIKALKKFWKDEEGAEVIAYAIVGAIVAALAVLYYHGTLGDAINSAITHIGNQINTVSSG